MKKPVLSPAAAAAISRRNARQRAAEMARRAPDEASSKSAPCGPVEKPAPPRRRVREETREEMLQRLTNPAISLYEAGVILQVCTATVRHYSNSGELPHTRTQGGQRRFYLQDVLALERQRAAERKARRRSPRRSSRAASKR